MQDNISEFLGVYGINHSAYMVLTIIRSGEPSSVTFRDTPETSVYQNLLPTYRFFEKAGCMQKDGYGRIATLKNRQSDI